jgi:hypothetical protein
VASTITQQIVKTAVLSSQRHRITIVASVLPGRAELLSALEAASWANARWYLALRERGLDGPCCVGCSGILYDPDRPAVDVSFATGDELVSRGKGSCGELVALDVGRRRADAMTKGSSVEQAARIAWPILEPEPSRPGEELWHALERTPSAVLDVTTEAPRTRAQHKAHECNCGGKHG